jgi:hypothetical protein
MFVDLNGVREWLSEENYWYARFNNDGTARVIKAKKGEGEDIDPKIHFGK